MTSTDPSDDEAKLAEFAAELQSGLNEHLGPWVERLVVDRLGDERAAPIVASLSAEVERALTEIGALLSADIDAQRSNPLAVVRSLVPPVTEALLLEGVQAVPRDPDAQRLFPDDALDLTPGAFGDLHPDLHLPGLAWGAAKAHVHLQRRRAEGLR